MSKADVRAKVSAEEWQLRVELAAAYRLVAHHRWTDMIFTHLSARVPGPEHHFLINPYGLLFEEITASNLVKVDLDGNIVMPSDYEVNPAGFCIHSAIHMAREDAQAVMHVHTPDGVAVATMACGLMPITQTSMIIHDYIAYHEYEGVALDLSERERPGQGFRRQAAAHPAQPRHAGGGSHGVRMFPVAVQPRACLQHAGARHGRRRAAYAERSVAGDHASSRSIADARWWTRPPGMAGAAAHAGPHRHELPGLRGRIDAERNLAIERLGSLDVECQTEVRPTE
jgi:hypothetical protein